MSKKGGHHGGAWKVAYADFVTAMMALFMVLWIVAQDEEIRIHTSRYFQSPFKTAFNSAYGVMPDTNSVVRTDSGTGNKHTEANLPISILHDMARQLRRLVENQNPSDPVPDMDVQLTDDGLRLIIHNRSSSPLFEENSAILTPWGDQLLQNLAWILERHTFHARIDAYAAGSRRMDGENDDAFDLAALQANRARKALIYYALSPDKVERVSGFAIPDSDDDLEVDHRLEISLALNQTPLKPHSSSAPPPPES